MKGKLTVTGKIGEIIIDEYDRSNGQFILEN